MEKAPRGAFVVTGLLLLMTMMTMMPEYVKKGIRMYVSVYVKVCLSGRLAGRLAVRSPGRWTWSLSVCVRER